MVTKYVDIIILETTVNLNHINVFIQIIRIVKFVNLIIFC